MADRPPAAAGLMRPLVARRRAPGPVPGHASGRALSRAPGRPPGGPPGRGPVRLGSFALALTLLTAGPVLATDPGEMLADPALEARAREIGRELRCLVCQNQSIDDSDAELARDLRSLVRDRLRAGDSDQQVVDYVVSRYGDFVLLRPPFKPTTWALWLGPAAFVAIGALALALHFRRRRAGDGAGPSSALDPDEERRVESLMKDGPA